MAGNGHHRTLWRFPVKSMLGEELDATEVSNSGLDHRLVIGDVASTSRSAMRDA